jgi:hypothetical protein
MQIINVSDISQYIAGVGEGTFIQASIPALGNGEHAGLALDVRAKTKG